jgi:hypothetical protein
MFFAFVLLAILAFCSMVYTIVVLDFGLSHGENFAPKMMLVVVMLAVGALSLLASDYDSRWSEWAECEDGITTVERNTSTVTIDDCDAHYKFPGGDND